mmetsp:Transcript_120907/g.338509  ORF Transcript_120907/g.338509 Transcript_120907/m.338509 type:complete len:413 (-) Transcript_120907:512-1750(-)
MATDPGPVANSRKSSDSKTASPSTASESKRFLPLSLPFVLSPPAPPPPPPPQRAHPMERPVSNTGRSRARMPVPPASSAGASACVRTRSSAASRAGRRPSDRGELLAAVPQLLPQLAAAVPGAEAHDAHDAAEAHEHEQGEDPELRHRREAAQQHDHDDDVERQAVQVVDQAADLLRHDVRLEHAHGWEVDADEELEDEESGEQADGAADAVLGQSHREGAGAEGEEAGAEGDGEALWRLQPGPQERGGGGAAEAGHHEHGEEEADLGLEAEARDAAEPLGDEDEHRGLEEGHDDADQRHLQGAGPGEARGPRTGLAPGAVVLVEGEGDEGEGEGEDHDAGVEGVHGAAGVEAAVVGPSAEGGDARDELADEARRDARDVHRGVHHAEHEAQEAGGELVPLRVLRNHPALEA